MVDDDFTERHRRRLLLASQGEAAPRAPRPTWLKRQQAYLRRATPRSRLYRRLYGSARWQALRATVLAATPICAYCPRLATQVDHRQPHHGSQELFFDRDNLDPICERCHVRKSARGR